MRTLPNKLSLILMSMVLPVLLSVTVYAQTNPAPQALPYTQDFSTLLHTSNTYPAGWRGWRLDAPPSAAFNTNAAIANAALTVSSDASLTNRRGHNYDGKIGMLNGANRDITLVLSVNTTGATGVNVAYDIMTIRNPYNGANRTRINEATLQYRVGTTGTFTSLTGIEYQNDTTNQITATTAPQNLQSKTITLPPACDNQPEVQLRWATREVSGSGQRPSFAVDNINVCAGAKSDAGSDQSSCTGADVLLNGTVIGATGGTWSTSGDGTFSPNNTTLNAAYTPGPNDLANGTVTLTLTADGTPLCAGGTDDMVITISGSAPVQPDSITGAPVSICAPFTGLALATNLDANATSYTWTAPGLNSGITFNPVSTTNTTLVDFAVTVNTTYTVHVVANNACGSSPFRSVNIRCGVSVPAVVNGAGYACPGDVKTYTATGSVGADDYTWTGPPGVLFDGNPTPYTALDLTVDVTFPAGWAGGDICIAANVACFTSVAKCINVLAVPPQPGGIIGNTDVCPPQAGVVYFVPNIAGLTYTWTAPPNSTIVSGQGSSTVTLDFAANYTTGDISVIASSACASSIVRATSINTGSGGSPVNKPYAVTGQVANVCGTTITYTALPLVANVLYNWNFPVGTLHLSQTANNITVQYPASGFDKQTFKVGMQSGCNISAQRVMDIKGGPLSPLVSGPASVCANTGGYVYTVPADAPQSTLVWIVPPGATFTGQGTTSITVTFGSSNGNVYCTRLNACGNSSGKVPVTITCRESASSADVAQQINFNTYPNPATENLTVEFSSSQNVAYAIKMIDLSGRVVSLSRGNASDELNVQKIDVSPLAPGLYIVSLETGDKVIQSRVVIE